MKTFFYIIGSIVFGALILIDKPLPEEPTPEFRKQRINMHFDEQRLNHKIIEVENKMYENRVLIQSELKNNVNLLKNKNEEK